MNLRAYIPNFAEVLNPQRLHRFFEELSLIPSRFIEATDGPYARLSGEADGSNAAFTVSKQRLIVETVLVYVDGVLSVDFSASVDGVITFTTPPTDGAIIVIDYEVNL